MILFFWSLYEIFKYCREYNKAEEFLIKAIEGFELFNDIQNMISWNLKLGQIKLINKDLKEAKRYADITDELWRKHQENYFLSEWVSLLDRVNESISLTSLNVFVFLKAFPLIDLKNNIPVGPITQKHNNFKELVSKNIKNENKIIRVKFDVLTRESLKSIKNHGWRVLHLSSDEYRDLQLCAEGKYGELDCIEISDLRDILIPFGGRLSIDVVVLAIPKSRLLAEIFIDLGVPHVVYFDFSDDFYKIYSKIDSVSNTPYEWIYSFCAEFYKHLVKGVTIKEALYKGREELKDTLREINKTLRIQNFFEEQIGEGPAILPENFDQTQSLYGSRDFKSTELKTGELIDMSRIRGPTNIAKPLIVFTGRKVEMFNLIEDLLWNDIDIVALSGPTGIGKTLLVLNISYFLNWRYYFNNGNFYFDLKKIKTAEQCK